jgi:flavin reductase (DIM6/NTAB) family NADH-FMN oxidoreductase RutF
MADAIDLNLFRRACGRFATGITITTFTGADGTPHGLTANSFTSVSMDPPLVLVCVDHKANVIHHFRAAKHFAVNVLAAGQQELSNRFAEKGQDRFEGVEWRPGVEGVPLLEGTIAQFECEVASAIDAGDHTMFLGRVLEARYTEGDPLLYFASGYRML